MVTAEEFHSQGVPPVQRLLRTFRGKAVYVTLDIDVVDPAYAPGARVTWISLVVAALACAGGLLMDRRTAAPTLA